MEVHKHPHHVMHKKNWKEYVLEFFMIFFAVTLTRKGILGAEEEIKKTGEELIDYLQKEYQMENE